MGMYEKAKAVQEAWRQCNTRSIPNDQFIAMDKAIEALLSVEQTMITCPRCDGRTLEIPEYLCGLCGKAGEIPERRQPIVMEEIVIGGVTYRTNAGSINAKLMAQIDNLKRQVEPLTDDEARELASMTKGLNVSEALSSAWVV